MKRDLPLGRQLYDWLPEVYRTRDRAVPGETSVSENSLARYLDAHGSFLDLIKATLDQRLADCFPDIPLDGGAVCQDWLLPYFADLLDVRLVSPDADGRRREIANAIAWRKGKGTLHVVESISESLSGLEAEVQEGWRRVAITPVIGQPMLPDAACGRNLKHGPGGQVLSSIGTAYPGLPAVTVDLRRTSRSVRVNADDPLARASRFGGDQSVHWMHANPHGVPRFAGSYEDVSRRSVDLRTPDEVQGHVHPERLLVYLPPFGGYFAGDVVSVSWRERDDAHSEFRQWIEVDDSDPRRTVYRNKTMQGNDFRPVRIYHVIGLGKDHEGEADAHVWRFEGLILDNTVLVHGGRLELDACAVRKLGLHSQDDSAIPLLAARRSLFRVLENPRALSRLEYCTVLGHTVSERIEASDCIFIGRIQKDRPTQAPPSGGCIRYCRVHAKQAGGGAEMFRASISRDYVRMVSTRFGEPGCGVLHPQTPAAVRFGAEDGGEMGAFHDRLYCLHWKAVQDKLADYLPLGMEAVLIADQRLLCTPPEQK